MILDVLQGPYLVLPLNKSGNSQERMQYTDWILSFGGTMIVNANGQLLAESPHGTDDVLMWEFDRDGGPPEHGADTLPSLCVRLKSEN